ncbi:MAG: glycosyltransferase [Armatimonadota bacterium]|nr:glycosyltransferase [Armatimonadota bacterium]
MDVLFVSPWYPDPPDNGAKIRISNLLSALCSRHHVTLIAAHDPGIRPSPALRQPLSLCEDVIPVPWAPRPITDVRRFLSYLWARPEWVFFAPSAEMGTKISRAIEARDPDLIITYEFSTARYLPQALPLPAILEDVELAGYLGSPETESVLRRARRRLFGWKLRRALCSLLRRFTACTVPSQAERDLLAAFVSDPPPVRLVPNCLDAAHYEDIEAQPRRETLILTGALTFGANRDAVMFFLQEVYPLIKQELPGVRFCITGRHNGIISPLIKEDPTVRLTGFVDDVRPLIAGSWVSVVPLLTGGGTRFKILEAMALGTPVVSTTKGAEGLAAESGKHLLIADCPADFAAAVVRICRDRALRQRLAEAGQELVAEEYTWQSVAPRYLAWVERVAADGMDRA